MEEKTQPDNKLYAAVFKAVIDEQGIESKVGQMDDGAGGTTYVIECSPTPSTTNELAVHCCFSNNSPVLLIVPQIAQVPANRRAAVLEACNDAALECLHTRFVVNEDGWLEARSWSIFITFDEQDLTGDVAMETLELLEEMNESLEDNLESILAKLQ